MADEFDDWNDWPSVLASSDDDRFTPLAFNPTPESLQVAPASGVEQFLNQDWRVPSSEKTQKEVEKYKKYLKKDPCENAANYEDYLRNRRAAKPRTKKSEDLSQERWEAICQSKGDVGFKRAPSGKTPAYMLDDTYADYVARMKKNKKTPMAQVAYDAARLDYAQQSGAKYPRVLEAEARKQAAAAAVAARPNPILSRIDGVWTIDERSGLINSSSGTSFLPMNLGQYHQYKKFIDAANEDYEGLDFFIDLQSENVKVRQSGADGSFEEADDDIYGDFFDI